MSTTSIEYKETTTVLHVSDLSVVYGDKTIINNINFEERDVVRADKTQGQCIAFVGRSGRGKSTLFRMLTGMESPTTGRVLIPDFTKPVTDGSQPAKLIVEGDVGFVDQKYTLFRNKTVYQALVFALRQKDLPQGEKEKLINEHLVNWGLDKVKNSFPFQLSGGQRQRTAILEQLLNSGHYIVLDEPFSGLDVGNIQSVKKAFKLIGDSHEFNTTIFSTHDIELAVELADSIYVIGYPKDANNNLVPTGTILKHFDLKKMGLAWETEFSMKHLEVANEIKGIMLAS
jgi:ABC-type nitrate/sulfonate/bicarbonate transport system ATPase subunit